MSEYKLVFLEKNDDISARKILDLRLNVFGQEEPEKLNINYWNWEFNEGYAGKSLIYLAIDKDIFVGHYAVIPNNFIIKGTTIHGSLVVDVMVHNDYRFQGIFSSIGAFALKDAYNKGVLFSIGFPVRQDVLPGHYKIGWKYYFDMPVIAYPINFKNLIHHFVKNKFISNIVFKPLELCFNAVSYLFNRTKKSEATLSIVESFDESFDELWSKLKNQFDVIQQRDSKFLNWRFVNNSYRKYIIIKATVMDKNIGYIVLRQNEIYGMSTLIIADVLVENFDKSVLHALIKETLRIARDLKVDLVGTKLIKNSKYYNYFIKNFFVPTGYAFKFIARNNCDTNQDLFENCNDIFFSWADSDTI